MAQQDEDLVLEIYHAVNHGNMARAKHLLNTVQAVNLTCLHHTDAERASAGAIRCPVCLSKSEAEREELRAMNSQWIHVFNDGSEMELFAALEAAEKLKSKYA